MVDKVCGLPAINTKDCDNPNCFRCIKCFGKSYGPHTSYNCGSIDKTYPYFFLDLERSIELLAKSKVGDINIKVGDLDNIGDKNPFLGKFISAIIPHIKEDWNYWLIKMNFEKFKIAISIKYPNDIENILDKTCGDKLIYLERRRNISKHLYNILPKEIISIVNDY